MAQPTLCQLVYEMTMARQVPKVMPLLTTVLVFLCSSAFFSLYGFIIFFRARRMICSRL